MTQINTNVSGIPDDQKKANSESQGSTQANISGINDGANANSGTPAVVPPIVDTKTFDIQKAEVAPPPPDIPKPIITPDNPVQVIKEAAPPVIPEIPKMKPQEDVDLAKQTAILQERKKTELSELEGEVNRQKENAFNRLTHDSIALQRDGGFVEATKVTAIRNGNIRKMDGMNSIKTEFNTNMLALEQKNADIKRARADKIEQRKFDADLLASNRDYAEEIRDENREHLKGIKEEDRDQWVADKAEERAFTIKLNEDANLNEIEKLELKNQFLIDQEARNKETKEEEEAEKEEEEEYDQWLLNSEDAIEQLSETDPQSALDLMIEYANSTDKPTPWDVYADNEKVSASWLESMNKEKTTEYDVHLDNAFTMMLDFPKGLDEQATRRKKDSLLEEFESNPLLFGKQIRTTFEGITVDNFEEYGVENKDELNTIMSFLEGGDINDPGLKDVFIDSFVRYEQTQADINAAKKVFTSSFEELSNDDSTSGILTAIIDDQYGSTAGGYIDVDMNVSGVTDSISSFGVNVTGANITNKAGFDFFYEDVNGKVYGENYSFNSELANNAQVKGVEGTHFSEYKVGQFNKDYQAYIEKKGKEWSSADPLNRPTIAEDVLNQKEYLQALIDGVDLTETAGLTTTTNAAGEEITFNNETSFKNPNTGEIISYQHMGIDLAKYDGEVVEAGKDGNAGLIDGSETVRKLFNGSLSINDFDEDQWNTMISIDPKLLTRLIEQGVVKSEDKGIGVPGQPNTANELIAEDQYANRPDTNILMSERNDSQFTGDRGMELYQSLDGDGAVKTGRMVIDNVLYDVTATPEYNNLHIDRTESGTKTGTAGGSKMTVPLIEFSLVPSSNPDGVEAVKWRGQVNIGGKQVFAAFENNVNDKSLLQAIVDNDLDTQTLMKDMFQEFGTQGITSAQHFKNSQG